MSDLTAARLREILDYDPETGVFRWRATRGGNKAGEVAGWDGGRGYAQVKLAGRTYRAHRLAWLYVYGKWPEQQVDHINGERADNRISNLREASGAENMQNKRAHRNNKSGFLGVSRSIGRKNPWQAGIGIGGTRRHLGVFATAEAAHAAYLQAKSALHPFYVPEGGRKVGATPLSATSRENLS